MRQQEGIALRVCTRCAQGQHWSSYYRAGEGLRGECKACTRKEMQCRRSYDSCPICGDRKRDVARTCSACRGFVRPGIRKCTDCAEEKHAAEFSFRSGRMYRPRCKRCEAANAKAIRSTDPERHEERKRAWERNNPVAFYRAQTHRAVRRAGVREADVLLALEAALHSKTCEICHVTLVECGGPNRKRLSIDHNHRTGAFRGMLCSNCNFGLGSFGDDAMIIRRAAEYLEKAR